MNVPKCAQKPEFENPAVAGSAFHFLRISDFLANQLLRFHRTNKYQPWRGSAKAKSIPTTTMMATTNRSKKKKVPAHAFCATERTQQAPSVRTTTSCERCYARSAKRRAEPQEVSEKRARQCHGRWVVVPLPCTVQWRGFVLAISVAPLISMRIEIAS